MQMLHSHPNGMRMLSLRTRDLEDLVRYFLNLKQEDEYELHLRLNRRVVTLDE